MSPRRTRSQTKASNVPNFSPSAGENFLNKLVAGPPADNGIASLPGTLTRTITRLSAQDQRILMRKQKWLRQYSVTIPTRFAKYASAIDVTLVFAQEEAGTAACIAPNGMILTCSHCVAENIDELGKSKGYWLLFRSGITVKANCVAWDPKRDLALLQIVAAQRPTPGEDCDEPLFPFITVNTTSPAIDSPLVCIGHPGSEDLEVSQPGVKTNYDVLHVSTGRFRGFVEGQDPQDNSEIGALMHDCWTYWGHSGAPLLELQTGKLVGLHSSWDDKTGMRRGVPLEAIQVFLRENEEHLALPH
ncbi:trypsin-like cysteine/serine peptidase domain-containing protein [Xylariaceae sp. FL1651]|nr:trypsin-like cysteine/serine peptidase domain-containing protein [Xylariaceae sp. FL1651]